MHVYFFIHAFWQWNTSAERFFKCPSAFFSHYPIVIFGDFLLHHFLSPLTFDIGKQKIKAMFQSYVYAKKEILLE